MSDQAKSMPSASTSQKVGARMPNLFTLEDRPEPSLVITGGNEAKTSAPLLPVKGDIKAVKLEGTGLMTWGIPETLHASTALAFIDITDKKCPTLLYIALGTKDKRGEYHYSQLLLPNETEPHPLRDTGWWPTFLNFIGLQSGDDPVTLSSPNAAVHLLPSIQVALGNQKPPQSTLSTTPVSVECPRTPTQPPQATFRTR